MTAPRVTPLSAPLPHRQCPLCGDDNACATAACGRFDTACWCHGASFPPALLARVPVAQPQRACICARCVGRAQASDPTSNAAR